MRGRIGWSAAMIAAAFALSAAGCGGDGDEAAAPTEPAAEGPITIGWAHDASGQMAPFDGPALAAARLEGRIPEAILMTVQNGLGAEEIVRRHGDWRLLSAVTFMSGTRHSDTQVEYVLDTETWLGPYGDTPPELAEETARLIGAAGRKARAFADLRPAQWSKLIFNATVNGVAALTGLPHDFHFAEGELGELVHALVDEGKRVADAAGIELHDDPWEMNVLATRRGSAHHPSMLEDVRAGRPTEVELINGALVQEGGRLAVPTPLHQALYALVKAREASHS